MTPVADIRRPRARRIAVAVWTAVLIGLVIVLRTMYRESGEPLLPASVLVGAALGVLVSGVGSAQYLRRLSETSVNGPPAPMIPWRVRRGILRLDPAPEPWAVQVPAWLGSRHRLARTLVPLIAWGVGQGLVVNSAQDLGWWGLAFDLAGWTAVLLLAGACATVYRRRVERALRRHPDVVPT